jgi:hypothetical protein
LLTLSKHCFYLLLWVQCNNSINRAHSRNTYGHTSCARKLHIQVPHERVDMCEGSCIPALGAAGTIDTAGLNSLSTKHVRQSRCLAAASAKIWPKSLGRQHQRPPCEVTVPLLGILKRCFQGAVPFTAAPAPSAAGRRWRRAPEQRRPTASAGPAALQSQ